MNVKIENHKLNSDLKLHDSSKTSFTLHTVTLSLTRQDNDLIKCRLNFQVTLQLYNRIDTETLFNLTPDLRNPSAEKFLPEPNITIETSLKPD